MQAANHDMQLTAAADYDIQPTQQPRKELRDINARDSNASTEARTHHLPYKGKGLMPLDHKTLGVRPPSI
nr:hypothetical protein Iba_scaffold489CG0070 [Ipomoea batatas]